MYVLNLWHFFFRQLIKVKENENMFPKGKGLQKCILHEHQHRHLNKNNYACIFSSYRFQTFVTYCAKYRKILLLIRLLFSKYHSLSYLNKSDISNVLLSIQNKIWSIIILRPCRWNARLIYCSLLLQTQLGKKLSANIGSM